MLGNVLAGGLPALGAAVQPVAFLAMTSVYAFMLYNVFTNTDDNFGFTKPLPKPEPVMATTFGPLVAFVSVSLFAGRRGAHCGEDRHGGKGRAGQVMCMSRVCVEVVVRKHERLMQEVCLL